MARTEKIEQIITKMEKLNDLWWDAEENKNQAALDQHNMLEQEIRADMADIGIDFDTVGAEYEDMISKLKGYKEEEEKEMSEETDWKKVLEDNRDAIEEKMVELYREWEGNNQDVHEGLGITRQGELFTWTYVGNYSEPESTWNGTDLCIATFSAWEWTDSNGDWKNIALSCAEDGAEKEKLMQRFEEEEEMSELELLEKEFPDLYEYIKDTEIDAEMDSYRENASELLDGIIRNLD